MSEKGNGCDQRLVEVGTEMNTLREAKKAAELFGDCLAQVLLRHYDD